MTQMNTNNFVLINFILVPIRVISSATFRAFMIIYFSMIFCTASSQCLTPINTFPYNEDFENSNGNWFAGGSGNDWQWGSPQKQVITGAASGNNCWVTGISSGAYASNALEWVQSPCFDFSNLKNPFIQFSVFWDTEPQYDGATLQASTDAGKTWQTVGAAGDKNCGNANWFNSPNIRYLSVGPSSSGWSGSASGRNGSCGGGGGSGQWLTAEHMLSNYAGKSSVTFRFVFAAGTICNSYDGFAFDNIVIDDQTSGLIVTSKSTNLRCYDDNDGAIIVNASGGALPYTYSWQPNVSDSFKAVNLAANNYTITVSDNNHCQINTTVAIIQPEPITATVSYTYTSCKLNDGSAVANLSSGTVPVNYSWQSIQAGDTSLYSNTGSSNQINSLIPGSYFVLIKDANNCTATTSSFIIKEQPPIKVSLGNDMTICPDTTFTITPGNYKTYLWQDGSTSSAYTIMKPGVYWVTVTDSNTCVGSDTILIKDGNCVGVYFPNAFTPNGDGVNDKFGMAGIIGPIFDYHLTIYNRWGQIVFESYNPSNKWDGKVNGFITGNQTFVWLASFIINDKKYELKGSVLVIQ
ncbi:T9SS type B sorting domain-containing protein [Ferruginibacter albus]|uniref:T9SS type B sorting domain-containing protein n=1 Tax=Ferruginibacter albus TaxID=2875540 RepID=UPI001CC69267|nr:gliding motility-associated C-terminal domain-containing protein [Ferruginibacter albus]UAY52553.1 gliding motility-associated C-terminal domain-containing protein [Ferruginibacter albus]